jgi:hypothetical protein
MAAKKPIKATHFWIHQANRNNGYASIVIAMKDSHMDKEHGGCNHLTNDRLRVINLSNVAALLPNRATPEVMLKKGRG